MKGSVDMLRAADPVANEPGLSPAEIRVMRRAVLDAVDRAPVRPMLWRESVAVAAVVVLMLVAGVTTGRRIATPEAGLLPSQTADDSERRQLQFATPGGTRIIWVFDPEFTLKESMP